MPSTAASLELIKLTVDEWHYWLIVGTYVYMYVCMCFGKSELLIVLNPRALALILTLTLTLISTHTTYLSFPSSIKALESQYFS